MPHDANGNLLQVGDQVTIPGKITSITTAEEYCNCTVELHYSMPPYTHKDSLSSINTKQVLLSAVQVPAAEAPAPDPAPAPEVPDGSTD